MKRPPSLESSAISSSAWATLGTRAPMPARRASCGSCSIAASAEPARLSSWRKVTGPTLSVRMRRSQATFAAGERTVPGLAAISGGRLLLGADLGLGALKQSTDIGPVVVDQEQ